MALTHKGSRPIVVDGIAYRWVVRRKPTYCQEMAWSPLSLAITAASDGLCTLHVQTPSARPDSVAYFDSQLSAEPLSVTPALVAHCIRLGLQNGWQPRKPGPTFALQLTPGCLPKPV